MKRESFIQNQKNIKVNESSAGSKILFTDTENFDFKMGKDEEQKQRKNSHSNTKLESSYNTCSQNNSYAPSALSKANEGSVPGHYPRRFNTLQMNDYKAFKYVKNIDKRYVFGRNLGQGEFGLVKLCMHQITERSSPLK